MEPVNPQTDPMPARPKKITRSWFTKKLERKFQEKKLDIPYEALNIMDLPFEDFTPEDKETYETKIKPFAFVYADHLIEVYESMDKPRQGWEDMLEHVEPSPIKVLAALVIHQDEKASLLPDEPDPLDESVQEPAVREKISVRVYNNRDKGKQKERRWGKKLF
jgi:hypothetical protein